MATSKSGKVQASVATVEEGIGLCEENVKRFPRNASILLDQGGSDGLAYVLWSLAVEEFGKAILFPGSNQWRGIEQELKHRLMGEPSGKFEAGFNELVELHGTSLAWVLRVTGNASPDDTVIEDPLQPGVTVTVPASRKGLFSDGLGDNDEVDPTVAPKVRAALS